MISSITASELSDILKNQPNEYTLIDVRSPSEYSEVHIPGSINIPLHLIPLQLNQQDSKKPIIFVCRSGGRSAQATMFADRSHYKAKNLSGGINDFENDFPESVTRQESASLFKNIFRI